MIDVNSIEEEIKILKESFDNGSYDYNNPLDSFKECTTRHFRNVYRKEKYGVYIVRKQDTKEIVYIGKGRTINTDGCIKSQDVPKRLKNVKAKDESADSWFRNIIKEYGPFFIEYIFLPKSKSPGFVESALLQAYLNENNHLPPKNKSL